MGKALCEEGSLETELAIQRIVLLYDVVMTVGGVHPPDLTGRRKQHAQR
jgi:hypothetical protein